MKYLLIAILAMFLAGCETFKIQQGTQVVEKIVTVKCNPKTQITPITEDPLDRATTEMSLFEQLQLALAELSLYRGQNKELKAALTECTK